MNKMRLYAEQFLEEEYPQITNDQKSFLKFLLNNCSGHENATPINSILGSLQFEDIHSKEQLQHRVIVPLREKGNFFVGTSSKGVYFIENADDAKVTIDFYTTRIRSEHGHLRNLRRIVKKESLFRKYQPGPLKESKSVVFFDESGDPSLKSLSTSRYFIVSAIIFEDKKEYKLLGKKFGNIRAELGKGANFEFKSTKLSKREYIHTLKELSTIDYTFASVCFDKKKLNTKGFMIPKSFYKYAFQYLLDRVLDFAVETELFFDEYSNERSKFRDEFLEYLKKQNIGFPNSKIRKMEMVSSAIQTGIQLADLIGGVLKNKAKAKFDLMSLIEDKMINVYYFPANPN